MPEQFDLPEPFDDPSLRAAFERYRTSLVDDLPSQDIAGVRTRARGRHRSQLLAGLTALLAALLVPAGAYAISGAQTPDPHRPNPPSPSVSTSQTPSPAPSAPGSPSSREAGIGGGSPSAPNGRIAITDLTRVRLDLPEWGWPTATSTSTTSCPTKQVTLRSGRANDQLIVHVDPVWYADVDGDGAQETVAMLECNLGQGAGQQVVVFDRNRAGSIIVLGQVVRNVVDDTASIERLYSVKLNSDGSMSIEVSDLMACCGTSDLQAEHQVRRYAWDGHRFRQVGGPTAFHTVPAEYGTLTTTTTPIVLSAATSGSRTGTASVTVTNAGPGTTPGVRLEAMLVDGPGNRLPVQIKDSSACAKNGTTSDAISYVCHYPSLDAGASRTYTLTVTSSTSNDSAVSTGTVHLAVHVNAEQPGIRVLGDYDTMNTIEVKLPT